MRKSLDSFEFKATLMDFFRDDAETTNKLKLLDWDTWFYKEGYPPKPDYDDSMVKVCFELAEKWHNRTSKPFDPKPSDIEGWVANQSVVFLEKLESYPAPPMAKEDVVLMGQTYGFAKSENIELVSRFYSVGLMCKEESVYYPTARLLGQVGRMKFVRPLFKLLKDCDRDFAIYVFNQNKDFYHPICRNMVKSILWPSNSS